jgi:hypothetical protein
VALSHSAKISTPLVGSASMGLASSVCSACPCRSPSHGRCGRSLQRARFDLAIETLIERTDLRVANSLHLVPFRDDFLSTADLGKSGLRKTRKVGFLRLGPRRPTCEESTLVAPPARYRRARAREDGRRTPSPPSQARRRRLAAHQSHKRIPIDRMRAWVAPHSQLPPHLPEALCRNPFVREA